MLQILLRGSVSGFLMDILYRNVPKKRLKKFFASLCDKDRNMNILGLYSHLAVYVQKIMDF